MSEKSRKVPSFVVPGDAAARVEVWARESANGQTRDVKSASLPLARGFVIYTGEEAATGLLKLSIRADSTVAPDEYHNGVTGDVDLFLTESQIRALIRRVEWDLKQRRKWRAVRATVEPVPVPDPPVEAGVLIERRDGQVCLDVPVMPAGRRSVPARRILALLSEGGAGALLCSDPDETIATRVPPGELLEAYDAAKGTAQAEGVDRG